MPIDLIKDIYAMQKKADRMIRQGCTTAFVPTMGFLHEGHLALLRKANEHAECVILSIFVNPTQFGPTEDLDKYPRNLERDLKLAEASKVDIVFAPEPSDMYRETHQTSVHLSKLPNHLCGLSRPGHFSGVATVVAKLFNIVKPSIAIFGEKDYQQLAIIRQLVEDLNFDVQLISVPTVREPDGLAMSSRNVYLSEPERASALSLNRSLREAQEMVNVGIRDGATILDRTRDHIHSEPHTKIDYVTLCDPRSLENVEWVNQTTVLALAVWVGKTRLIDNAVLSPPDR